MKKLSMILTFVLLLFFSIWVATHKNSPEISQLKTPTTNSTSNTQPKEEFNNKMYSITDPTSIWFIANKHSALPLSYEPSDLTVLNVPLRLNAKEMQMQIRKVAADDLMNLFTEAKTAGLQLEFGSGYRSAAYQKVLYDGYVQSMGKSEADRSSARPGHSEHQTGLALDFTRVDGRCHLEACFNDLPEGKWLASNAYTYGFILRYTYDKEKTTGYMFEPWHYRYVGKELATEMHKKGIQTLEEFFATGSAPDYLN